MMKANFFWGTSRPDDFPVIVEPQIVFWGRSNVGKSSLINSLTETKNLAKTSKTPGRTQQINFFRSDSGLVLVDFPGYGHHNAGKNLDELWPQLLTSYFKKFKPAILLLLIDSRRDFLPIDETAVNWLDGLTKIAKKIIYTKSDKKIITALTAQEAILVSSKTNAGIKELRNLIKSYTLI